MLPQVNRKIFISKVGTFKNFNVTYRLCSKKHFEQRLVIFVKFLYLSLVLGLKMIGSKFLLSPHDMPSWCAEGQLYLLHMILSHVPWLCQLNFSLMCVLLHNPAVLCTNIFVMVTLYNYFYRSEVLYVDKCIHTYTHTHTPTYTQSLFLHIKVLIY